MKNNKTLVVAIAALAIIGIISGTYAYFMSSATVSNSFIASSYSTVVQRDIKDGNWLPGTTISIGTPDKDYENLNVKNTGNVPIIVRAKIEETLENTTTKATVSKTLTVGESTEDVVVKGWNASWKKGSDDYYYYTGVVTAGNQTTNLVDSLTFNKAASNNSTCVEVTDANKSSYPDTPVGYVVCSSGANAYDNTTYTLAITFETAQYNIDTWSGAPTELTSAISSFVG